MPPQQQYPPQQAYGYDPNWQPPQVVGSTDPNANVVYNYDPLHVTVQYISVDQWGQIENDKSPYTYLWEKGEFTPEKFSENQKRNDVCLDKCWFYAFYINLLIVIALMIAICSKNLDEPTEETQETATEIVAFARSLSSNVDKEITDYSYNSSNSTSNSTSDYFLSDEEYDEIKLTLIKGVFIGIGVGLGLTVLHFAYMACNPTLYIKVGLWIGVGFIILVCIIPFFISPAVAYPCLAVAGLILLIAICMYCFCLKDFIEFTCMVFEKTMQIEKNHPMIFLVCLIAIVIEFVFNIIFEFAFFFILLNQWSYVLYLYYLFSYYWVITTNFYTFYLISANLAALNYFLEGTEYYPENALWDSVKKSLTKTFGSASLAGFISAILYTLEYLASELMDADNIVLKIIGCICYCILCCLEAIFHHVSRYGLFYVTVYNVPFLEGARRFTEIQVKKFINTFMGECILETSLTYNSYVFGLISIVLGIVIGWGSFVYYMDKNMEVAAIITLVFYPIFVIFCTEIFLWVLLNPAETITYALFICFTEYPERLKIVNNVQYEQFVYRYSCSTARATNNPLPPSPQVY